MWSKFKVDFKLFILLSVYITIVVAPFVLLYFLHDMGFAMSIFSAFIIINLIGNAFGVEVPRIWRLGSSSTNILIIGGCTAIISFFAHTGWRPVVEAMAGVALADLFMTSIALLLLHAVSLNVCHEWFDATESFKKNPNHILFKVIKLVSLEVYKVTEQATKDDNKGVTLL